MVRWSSIGSDAQAPTLRHPCSDTQRRLLVRTHAPANDADRREHERDDVLVAPAIELLARLPLFERFAATLDGRVHPGLVAVLRLGECFLRGRLHRLRDLERRLFDRLRA